ncbi:MAG: bifunctional hydroxymethylpyrimidine kinase/phosphomethylpyrimidine kinase [Kiritimatiellae bacterium]|nr:bifunctional hydroxymethylpyrimidine kinase/phosphomethylpyrimidine kinase [Kiritimatiellia bacterium]
MDGKDIRPCVLTVAGSDSGGNAGIEADLRVMHDFELHGCVALTALTAQNPSGVAAIHNPPPEFVSAQIATVKGVYDIRAAKTGMLPSKAIIAAAAGALRGASFPIVVDPVMIATSGAKLIEDDAVETLEKELIPLAALITPNLPEARRLARMESEDDAARLAAALYARFGVPVLVKGGHAEGEMMVDVMFDGKTTVKVAARKIENPVSTHGTGCSLSAAIASCLALGEDLAAAVARAKKYVYCAIRDSYLVGENCGVLSFARD